jgi:glycosyltransferase involved in cell wall biosynthesis
MNPSQPVLDRQPFIHTQPPVRVLHVVGGMNPGGVETWLLQILQRLNRDRIQSDFWVHTSQACLYDSEIRALGSQIIAAPRLKTPWAYAKALKQLLQQQSYDVVHSHVHHFSGAVLKVAQSAGVPVRIAHSHLDTSALDDQATVLRRCYLQLTRHWIQRHATLGVSASGLAAASLFGQNWQMDPRWQRLYYGVNLQPYAHPTDGAKLRAELHIPANAKVIGHVGRFETQKNHVFLVNVVAEVLQHQPNTYLLLVGQGALLPDIQAHVQALGIRDRVIFAGVRRDVPHLMQSVMDVMVLPSWQEGLPLVLIEAQAAGLPCIISDRITPEADILPNLIHRCGLERPIADWVNVTLAAMHQGHQPQFDQIQSSAFNIEASVQALETLYLESLSYAV